MKTAILRLALIGGAALAVTGCTSTGYGHYGYAGLSYGYASPYYGWYDDYYYPGTGYYVYERSGARHRWTDSQRRYWQSHRGGHDRRENWTGYRRSGDGVAGHGWTGGAHDGHRASGGHRSGHDTSSRRSGGHRSGQGGTRASNSGNGSSDGGRHHHR